MLTNESLEKALSPFSTDANGNRTWHHLPGDQYIVTGIDTRGKRFKALRFDSWYHARCINLYRGNYWLLRNNRRYRIQSVWN